MPNIEQIENKDNEALFQQEGAEDVDTTEDIDKEIDKNKQDEDLLKKDGKKKPNEVDPDTSLDSSKSQEYGGDLHTSKEEKIKDRTIRVDNSKEKEYEARTKAEEKQNRKTKKSKEAYLEAQKDVPDVKEEETPVPEGKEQEVEEKPGTEEDNTPPPIDGVEGENLTVLDEGHEKNEETFNGENEKIEDDTNKKITEKVIENVSASEKDPEDGFISKN